jgi:hypothetical protein
MVAVIVVFAISMALFGLWAQSAVREHRRLAGHELRVQAGRLAEAGLQRAIARRAANAQYDGETWSIPAAVLGGAHAAEVRIRIAPAADAGRLRVEAVAEFPVGAVQRAQVTKHIDIPNQSSGTES